MRLGKLGEIVAQEGRVTKAAFVRLEYIWRGAVPCNGAIETAVDEAVPKDGETLVKTDDPRFRLLATKTH